MPHVLTQVAFTAAMGLSKPTQTGEEVGQGGGGRRKGYEERPLVV
jgi:hypothetical protein